MTMVAQDIGFDASDPFMAGDTLDIPVTIDDPADFDLSAASAIKWQVHRLVGAGFHGEAVLSKSLSSGITVTSPTAPAAFNIHVDAADTEDLAGTYYHEAEVRMTGGAVHTVFKGRWQITQDAVRVVA